MSMIAAGAYLKTLRLARGLKPEDIAVAVGVNPKQIARWEDAENQPAATALAYFVEAVQGDIRDVYRLLLDKDAGEKEGIDMANRWLKQADQNLAVKYPDWTREQRNEEIRRIIKEMQAEDQLGLFRWMVDFAFNVKERTNRYVGSFRRRRRNDPPDRK